jgi:hypothetical protein
MSLTESANELLDSIIAMPGQFADVAMHDPLSAVLIAFGGLFVTLAVGAFGYLSLGAFISFLSVENA